jgi:hypothetical protein
MYFNYCEDFELVYNWLKEEDGTAETESYREFLPDLCGNCLEIFPYTRAGRVREKCGWCNRFGTDKPFLKLEFYWAFKLSEILNCSESVLESYTAEAISRIRYAEGKFVSGMKF